MTLYGERLENLYAMHTYNNIMHYNIIVMYSMQSPFFSKTRKLTKGSTILQFKIMIMVCL